MMEPGENKEPDYEKAEMDLLRASLKQTYEERFRTMTKLMRRSIMLKNAKVVHKPLNFTIAMQKNELKNKMSERQADYGFVNKSEDEKLLEDMSRSGLEKLQLFTNMLRRNKMLNKAMISIKK